MSFGLGLMEILLLAAGVGCLAIGVVAVVLLLTLGGDKKEPREE